MKTLIEATLVVLVSAIACNSLQAKEWRGLVPLRSTRTDVVRLMGQCSEQREACRFTLESEDVYILFSRGLATKYAECAERIPPETIMFIQVKPQRPLKFSDQQLDKKKFTSFNPSAPFKRGFQGYRNSAGLVIQAYKGRILQLNYIPDESDRHLCQDFYEPESFVAIFYNHYDSMYVDGPETIKAGETLKLFASANINDKCGYTWTLSAGRIASGQYTQQITVDTTELAGQKIVITAEIGYQSGHYIASSRTIQILPR